MANPRVTQVIGPQWEITLYTAITCTAGNLLAHNGTGWVLADPSTPATLSAKAVACNTQTAAAGKVQVCREAVVRDEDAPFTLGNRIYLGNTAGSYSETIPTTDGDLIQVVGVALDTYEAHLKIKPPRLEYAFVTRDLLDTSSEPGLGTADAGWAVASLTSTETAYTAPWYVPENAIALVAAHLVFNSNSATAGDLDISIVGAYFGASNVQDTGTPIVAGDWAQTDTNNIILTMDVSTVIDAGMFLPGRLFQLYIDPDGITGDAGFLGMQLCYQVVD